MTPETATRTYGVRAYDEADEGDTIALMSASLGRGPTGERSRQFFRWKHLDNPFGRSHMLLAMEDDLIVGFRSFMRWRFRVGGTDVSAIRAVDTATHPDHRGRGIFSMLTRRAIEELSGEVDLVFNTPNEKSGPGYLKMGWRTAGKIPISVRVRRPIRFARGAGSLRSPLEVSGRPASKIDAPPASDVLNSAGIEQLLGALVEPRSRLATARDTRYLRWRYASAPQLDYRALIVERAGAVVGLAIFRVRPRGSLREATVCELIAEPADGRTLRRLLRSVASAAPVDHITCHFFRGSKQLGAARFRGFLPTPGGMTFVVNPLRDALPVDPESLDSWALSLGDLEVF